MRNRFAVALLVCVGMLAVPATSMAYLTGVADENATMFVSPLYKQLIKNQPTSHRISRYIAPYDVANANKKNTVFLNRFINWYNHAQADHVQMLVAFYHSELTPTKMPSTKAYQQDISKFMRRFPKVTSWQPWNEANRGNVAHMFDSPSATQSARYYKAMKDICHEVTKNCTIVALDILDQDNVKPTLTYVAQFKTQLRALKVPMPQLWGLHNYSDTNRYSGTRTTAILGVVPGDVWLTETGGIVNFGGAFPNKNGSGNTRATKALTYMFKLASAHARIKRLYIFAWTGAPAKARFDAGLTDVAGLPRPGYAVVCKHMRASKCSGYKVDTKH